jgi:NAD+ dependent glucose-6-phosphate dehydrogenase
VSGTSPDKSGGVSDNDRKYYSIERAREVLGYDPQDNSAEWNGDEHVDGDSR